MECKDCKWKYLAGVIDTDGCIYMRIKNIKKGSSYFYTQRQRRYFHKKDYVYHLVSITVHMTSEKFIKHLHSTYNVGRYRKNKREGYRRDSHSWIIENPEQVTHVLRNILPYLIIKKRQAKLGIETLKKKGCDRGDDRLLMIKLNVRGRIPQEEKI